MKTTRIMLLAAVLLGALPVTGSAATSISAGLHLGSSGHARVDVGFFYDDLASYGNWIQRPRYGWVWTPRVASRSWRPYENGHWVWTDLGWTWVSTEAFGWATYHYGRWYDDPDYGWGWVPGDQWAPAWVDWHAGNDYVGWAPLPPSVGYSPGVTLNVDLAPEDFVFVPERNFLDVRVARFAVPSWQCGQIYRGTRNFTRYNRFNNQVFNAGLPIDQIQRVTGRRVQRYQVADLGWNQRHQGGRFGQNRVAFFRPQVENARVAAPSARPIARRAVLAGAAATAAITAHHAFRAAQANHQPQGLLRQQNRAQQRQAQVQQQKQGRQQRQQLQQQARLQQQQGRALRQTQVRQQQQAGQLQRSQRQEQQKAQAQARVEQRQVRSQRQAQMKQQQLGRQQPRFQRQQQQQVHQQARLQQQQQGRAMRQQQLQARQQERSQQQQARAQRQQQRQAQAQQRPQRQMQQAQAQQARQQARQQRQGNPGQQGNHHRQRPPQ